MANIEMPLDLYKALFEPFPEEVKSTEKMGRKGTITFVEWYHYISRAWREFPEGFSTEVREVYAVGTNAETSQLIMIVRVTDNATGIFHEGSGSAPLTKPKKNFGGCNAEAEAQALKRAFAKFGLGLEMYMDQEDLSQADPAEDPVRDATKRQIARMRQLVRAGKGNTAVETLAKDLKKKVESARDKEFHTAIAIEEMERQLQQEDIDVPDPS